MVHDAWRRFVFRGAAGAARDRDQRTAGIIAGGIEMLFDVPLPRAVLRSLGSTQPANHTGDAGLRSEVLLRELRRGDVGTILLERGATADDRTLIRELLEGWPGSVLTLQGDEC